MGLRFRKHFKIAPGVKISLNKNSMGITLGGKGAQYTVNTKGRTTSTVGIPSTGLSYSSFSNSGKTKRKKRQPQPNINYSAAIPETKKVKKTSTGKTTFIVWSVLTVIMILGVSPVWWIFLIVASIYGYRFFKRRNALNAKDDPTHPTTESSMQEISKIDFHTDNSSLKSFSDAIAKTNALTAENQDWKISVSFGKSTSQNYQKAVFLAKAAPVYNEQIDDGHVLHQAIYSAKPQEYLAFISLYELVSNWKSSFVMINGRIMDRKIIGQLNYCYGDNCRSGNPRFCFGASELTENPFGCHRLQISAANHPWWSFSIRQGTKFYIDKHAIKERIDGYAEIYHVCPSFDYKRILHNLDALPSVLSIEEYQKQFNSLHTSAGNYIELTF